MTGLNEALSRIVKLIVLSRDYVIGYNLVSVFKDQLDCDQYVYALTLEEYHQGDHPAIVIVSKDETAVGKILDEDFVSLSIPIELVGFPSLANLLNGYRSDVLWDHTEQTIRGTLNIDHVYRDHGVEPLVTRRFNFEIDKVSQTQLLGREDQLVQELDLLLRWADFLCKCFGRFPDDEVFKVHKAAQSILKSFGAWESRVMDRVLLLCTLTGDLSQFEKNFPEVFKREQ
jgi:hypothetical protein